MSSLFILETALYQICLLQIFSPSLWLILSFSWHCFCGAVFNFNEVQLINSSFHGCVFGVVSKQSLPHPRSCRFSPMLSFRSFIVVYLTFKSGIHFELIFVKGTRSVSTFFFFFYMWMSSCSSTVCWKDYLCTIVSLLLLCRRSLDYVYVALFLGSLYCSFFALVPILWSVPHFLNYCSFVVSLGNR